MAPKGQGRAGPDRAGQGRAGPGRAGAYKNHHLECECFHAILSLHLVGFCPFSTCAFCQLHSARDVLCSHFWTQSRDKDLAQLSVSFAMQSRNASWSKDLSYGIRKVACMQVQLRPSTANAKSIQPEVYLSHVTWGNTGACLRNNTRADPLHGVGP